MNHCFIHNNYYSILCLSLDMTTIALKPYDTIRGIRYTAKWYNVTANDVINEPHPLKPKMHSAAAQLEVQPSKLQEVFTTKSTTELQSPF